MAIASDVAHLYGGDIGVTPTGDIAMVSGSDRTTQRVIRKLITAATTLTQSDYPWQPLYGAGLGQKVGLAGTDPRTIQALVKSQLLQEQSVVSVPTPTVTVTQVADGIFEIDCSYTDQSGLVQSFSFDLN
jgi:hypothetical protein